jgi:hypothetical protein
MTVDLDRPSRSFSQARTESAAVHPMRSGSGKQPDRVIDVPRILLLLRERCDDMIEMRPGPDQPRGSGRPAAGRPVPATAPGVST